MAEMFDQKLIYNIWNAGFGGDLPVAMAASARRKLVIAKSFILNDQRLGWNRNDGDGASDFSVSSLETRSVEKTKLVCSL